MNAARATLGRGLPVPRGREPSVALAIALADAPARPFMASPPSRPEIPPDTRPDAPPVSETAAADARIRRMVDDDFPVVWRFLRGLGVPSGSVDDAAQQVFLVAAKRVAAITPGSERAFLLATARGVAANARRAQSRSREVLDDTAMARHKDDGANPEQAVAARQARAQLDSFLASLDDDVRAVFVLFELEGLTMAAIAETLSLPPGTVASRLRRGREEFHAAARRIQAQRGGGR